MKSLILTFSALTIIGLGDTGSYPVQAGMDCTSYEFLNSSKCRTDEGTTYDIQRYPSLNQYNIRGSDGTYQTCTEYSALNKVSCR